MNFSTTIKSKYIGLSLIALTALQSCDSDDETSVPEIPKVPIPESILISEKGLFPEGIDFDNNSNQFIVGSVVRSEVGIVNPQTGAYTAFVTDPKLASVTGVYTDEGRNRLLAVSGNLGFSQNSSSNPETVAYLGIYNLTTGALIQGVDLTTVLDEGAASFANDIAVDDEGNIYITDSFSPVIYKVDGASFEASIFLDGGADFTPAPMGFGLNGIVYTDGNLVVCKTDNGALFKIPVADPSDYSRIAAPEFVGGDGLELTPDGQIILVENALGNNPGTQLLSSTDQWATATLVSSFDVDAEKFPTTATLADDGEIYVLNAYLGKALGGDLEQETFSILRTNQ